MTTNRLSVILPPAEPAEGWDYDSIDLSPAQGRKGAGIAWAELGEIEGQQTGFDVGADAENDLSTSLATADAPQEPSGDDDGSSSGTATAHIMLDLDDKVLDVEVLGGGDDTYTWNGSSTLVEAGDGNDTLVLDGAAENYVIYYFNTVILDEVTAANTFMAVLDRATGERIVGRAFEHLSFGDGTEVTLPEGTNVAGYAGGLLEASSGELRNVDAIDNGYFVSFEQDGSVATAPVWALDLGSGRISDLAEAATILGTDGSDVLRDTAGADIIAGGAGNDTLISTETTDSNEQDVYSFDLLFGGAGNDQFRLGDGNAHALGGSGDDTFHAGTGTFSVAGQQGYDTLVLGQDASNLIVMMYGEPASPGFTLMTADGLTLGWAITIDELALNGGESWRVSQDDLRADAGYYKLVEIDGGLELSLYATFDEVDRDPTLIGGQPIEGGDEASYDAGHSVTPDPSVQYGSDGDDVMTAAPLGFIDGGLGYDTLDLSNLNYVEVQRLSVDMYSVAGPSSSVLVSNIEAIALEGGKVIALSYDPILDGTENSDVLFAARGGSVIDGGGGDDSIRDADGVDELHGGAGSDHITSVWGHDRLYGDDGDDTIFANESALMDGGDGNDTLNANSGTVIGGAGADLFVVYALVAGATLVKDFTMGEDSMLVRGIGAEPTIKQVGSDTVISFEAHTLTLENVSKADLLAENSGFTLSPLW